MRFMHATKQQSSDGSVFTHKLLGDAFAVQLEQLRVLLSEVSKDLSEENLLESKRA